jgi:CheY-like chemotaxis protein
VLGTLGPDHPSSKDIAEVRHAGESAARLTRQLLAFSRRQILQPRVLDLNQIVERMDALVRRVIGEDVVFETRLSDTLKRVNADPGQIEQVLMNLAVNARDAMPDGGQLTIETADVDLDESYVSRHGGASPGPHVMLAMSDTGVGMNDETLRRVFEPFFTTKEAGKGTGLGLATVYGIVKQSHGSIWVYSEPGHGSTFKIYLPAIASQGSADTSDEETPRRLTGMETVLIVEDQAEVRGVIRTTLRRNGYTVLEATNGQEALALSRGHAGPIHLLFTDVVMPGLSGRRVAEILTAERRDMRVLYTSGYTDDAIVRHGVLEPGLAFLQKPYTSSAMLRKLRSTLDTPNPPAV